MLECPHNEASRRRVRTALRVALPLAHPRLQFVTTTLSNEKLILASLGAPIHLLPPHHPLYEAFIQAAAAAAWFSETIPLGVCLRVSKLSPKVIGLMGQNNFVGKALIPVEGWGKEG